MTLRIGVAGWAIPRPSAAAFPASGSGLERYASRFNAVEVNSTFYRSHRPATLQRWAAVTPRDFRFAVKLSRAITHEARLVDTAPLVEAFVSAMTILGAKLGPILVQLPPSLAFEPTVADRFFGHMREVFGGAIVCEPRHQTWFDQPADRLLAAHRIARVVADPAPDPRASQPGGWQGVAYWRLHGSPQTYVSAYQDPALAALARTLRLSGAREAWCVFDNTARGAAAGNALRLQGLLEVGGPRSPRHSTASDIADQRAEPCPS